MTIERTTSEIILRLPASLDTASLQKIIEYLKYKEASKTSQATEKQANDLANESKSNWWIENKAKFIK